MPSLEHGAPILPRWCHAIAGIAGVVTASCGVDGRGLSIVLVLAAVAYVGWTAGRMAAAAAIIVTTACELARGHGDPAIVVLLIAGVSTLAAAIAIGVEAHTRPD